MKNKSRFILFFIFSALIVIITVRNKFFFESDAVELARKSRHVMEMSLAKKSKWAMIIHGLQCYEAGNLLIKDWDVYIRMDDKLIVNCQNGANYTNLVFIKNFIENGGEKLALFNSLPADISTWTNQYTLYMSEYNEELGEVCKDRLYSLTLETGDFTMKDWNIPFYIKNRKVHYFDDANIVLERETLWLFPLLRESEVVTPILSFLSSNSIIRTIDNKQLKRRKYPNGPEVRFNEDTTVLNFLKGLRKTYTLNRVIEFLEKTNYNVSLNANPNSEKKTFCSVVKWKGTGEMPVKDPDCHEIEMNMTLKGQVPARDDALLVIVYNKLHYENMPYVNSLYGKLFKYMAYCGPNKLPHDFNGIFATYVHIVGGPPGHFGQLCASIYLSMRHKHTKHLLITADDMLLNTHTLNNAPTNKFWTTGRFKTDIRTANASWSWRMWWTYKNTSLNLLKKLHASNDEYLKTCADTLREVNGHNYTIVGGHTDTYFVPYIFQERFLRLNEFFLQNWCPFEIALPTIFYCLKNTYYFKAYGVKRQERDMQWKFLDKFHNYIYMHPVKWGKMMAKNEDYPLWRNLYCRSKAYINDKSNNPSILKFYKKEKQYNSRKK